MFDLFGVLSNSPVVFSYEDNRAIGRNDKTTEISSKCEDLNCSAHHLKTFMMQKHEFTGYFKAH